MNCVSGSYWVCKQYRNQAWCMYAKTSKQVIILLVHLKCYYERVLITYKSCECVLMRMIVFTVFQSGCTQKSTINGGLAADLLHKWWSHAHTFVG